MPNADLILDCRNAHGEGVFWNPADGRFWWADIDGKHLWWRDPVTGASGSIPVRDRPCCFAPRNDGTFIIAFARDIALFDPATGKDEIIHRFEPDKPRTRLNDGRTDRQGRLVAGGMNEGGDGALISSVVRVDADLTVTTIVEGIGCTNSICFTPDGRTMFLTDSFVGDVFAFGYDTDTGTPGQRRILKSYGPGEGSPDGSCVDAEGAVWNAVWDGYRVQRILPDGTVDQVIDLPVPRVTCCAFGGPDLATLTITTSRQGMSEADVANAPLSGSLFAFTPGVTGVRDAPFAG